jgi:aquaporin Z
MEAGELAAFMVSACVVGVLLEHPSSPIHLAIESDWLRRVFGGLAMGATALGIIFSRWGKRSGAHLNPAVTLTFWQLGKVAGLDAVFYIAAQFAGGIAGVALADLAIGPPLRHSAVNYAVTVPGVHGPLVAFAAEFLISLLMMSVILRVSNHAVLSRYTPFFAAALVALFISVESPLSGMSMNPARTFGSAFRASEWTGLWIYFTAPPLAMGLAGLLYQRHGKGHRVFCAKLHHHNSQRCIFRCNFEDLR